MNQPGTLFGILLVGFHDTENETLNLGHPVIWLGLSAVDLSLDVLLFAWCMMFPTEYRNEGPRFDF